MSMWDISDVRADVAEHVRHVGKLLEQAEDRVASICPKSCTVDGAIHTLPEDIYLIRRFGIGKISARGSCGF